MTDRDALVREAARAICEAGNVPGFKCGCPHPVDGWCLGGAMPKKASAALALILTRVADDVRAHGIVFSIKSEVRALVCDRIEAHLRALATPEGR